MGQTSLYLALVVLWPTALFSLAYIDHALDVRNDRPSWPQSYVSARGRERGDEDELERERDGQKAEEGKQN